MSKEATATKKKGGFSGSFREAGLIIFIVLISVIVQIRNHTFLTAVNINNILVNTSILAILSVGMMMVLLTGGIDLSLGAAVALSGMCAALTLQYHPNVPVFIAIIEGIAIGAAGGAVLGVLIARFDVLAIIASLGLMNVLRGLTYIVSGGKWVSAYQMPDKFKDFATGSFLGVNHLVLIAVAVYIVFYYFINHTKQGRWIYAVGSNPGAAEVSGIPKKRTVMLVYVLMGAISGLAGVLWVAKYASAQGDTASGYEMNVIAACVLGGVSVNGGRGKVSGLVIGCLLFGILQNALPLVNVSPFWQNAIRGAVILAAVISNVYVKRRAIMAALRAREL